MTGKEFCEEKKGDGKLNVLGRETTKGLGVRALGILIAAPSGALIGGLLSGDLSGMRYCHSVQISSSGDERFTKSF